MNVITWAWWHLPLSRENKEKLKSFLFTVFPFIFQKSRAYRNWQEARIFSKQQFATMDKNQAGMIKEANSFSTSDMKYQPELIPEEPISELAIVIHAFHLDVFKEILDYLKKIEGVPFKIFVTSPANITKTINTLLATNSFEYNSIPVENRGRDILPFLKMLPYVVNDGYQVILKIHTKKSDHRRTGQLWRNDLYNKLLKKTAIARAIQIFNTDLSIGLIGAHGHIVPMHLYYGANANRVERMCTAMGVESSQLTNLNFPAGSMFFARKQALIPILNLNINPGDFEDEKGQKDGTMAHAMERAFSVSTYAAHLKLVDMTFNTQQPNPIISKDHHFTH